MPPTDASALLTIVGAGTLVPSAQRGSAAHHLKADGVSLLMDCGPGTLHGLAAHGVEWEGLTHLAISHFHNDHLGDIPALFFALKYGTAQPRAAPLTLLGPHGLWDVLRRLADALGEHVLHPGFDVDVVELDGDQVFADPGGAWEKLFRGSLCAVCAGGRVCRQRAAGPTLSPALEPTLSSAPRIVPKSNSYPTLRRPIQDQRGHSLEGLGVPPSCLR